VEAHLMAVVVDVAGADAEARVVVGEKEDEALHETLPDEPWVLVPASVHLFEAAEGEAPHMIAMVEVALQAVDNVAFQDTIAEQAVEAWGEHSWMPLNEWED
jgi:hypothetical protein